MPNLIPQDIREWMRRVEFKLNDLIRRTSDQMPGEIADAVDLNDYQSSGRWVRESTTGVTTALNYPTAGVAGVLEVYQNPPSTNVIQKFTDRVNRNIWIRFFNGVSWSAWGSGDSGGLPLPALGQVAATQNVTAATPSPLPTPVTAQITVPAGTTIVGASVSALIGSTPGFTPAASGSVRYWLSGALTFQPGTNTSAVGGVDEPVASGGGTLSLVHTVTVAAPTVLTIEAMAMRDTGAVAVPVRDVRVQLTAMRRG